MSKDQKAGICLAFTLGFMYVSLIILFDDMHLISLESTAAAVIRTSVTSIILDRTYDFQDLLGKPYILG